MSDIATKADALRQIPTTLAADLLKDQDIHERSATGLREMNAFRTAFAGPARTIAFLPGRSELRAAHTTPVNFLAIDTLRPNDVLVLAAGGSMRGAILGDMLATRAVALRASGAVVDGAVRDLAGLKEAGLPFVARGVAPMAAHATLVPVAYDVPVRFGDITVLPGDWILADEDGVLVLPLDLVDLVIARQANALGKEGFSRRLLTEGFPLADVFPLPEALAPFLDEFSATGTIPDLDAVRTALAGSRDVRTR